jgi:anaerobic ribonucleoside-triphosphate reductase activating protein
MGTHGILVNLIAYPVTVLGYGKRVGLWTQGCSIGCTGCMSKHTWEFTPQTYRTIEAIMTQLNTYGCDRITISGGEPFEQPDLLYLLQALKESGFKDVMVYSGYSEQYIRTHFSDCLIYIDALVSEPFIEGLESERLYKGSDNQKLIVLNETLKQQYKSYVLLFKNKKLQKYNDVIIGIPYQKDVKALHEM